MTHPLDIRAVGELEIEIKRVFDAPPKLVFDAWTKPELLRQWLGKRGGWDWDVCEVDLRVGGAYRYVWKHAEGMTMGMGGVFREIVVPERIVSTEKFDASWYPGEAMITNVLEERDGKTVSVLTCRYETTEARDVVLASPMDEGLGDGFKVLDDVLGTLL